MPKSASKSLSTAANLANLLPTGTVLAFQALSPSFSNNGSCLPANRFLTLGIIVVCSVVCFFSSLTDSFIDENGKLIYGIATFKGLHILNGEDHNDNKKDVKQAVGADKDLSNRDDHDDNKKDVEQAGDAGKERNRSEDLSKLRKYRIRCKDFVHAISSLLVFLVFATSSTDVQRCFFPHAGANGNTLMMNLPLAVGAFASFLFMIFPTKRRGIGYADSAARKCPNCKFPQHDTESLMKP